MLALEVVHKPRGKIRPHKEKKWSRYKDGFFSEQSKLNENIKSAKSDEALKFSTFGKRSI
jgi:hypothetical protein